MGVLACDRKGCENIMCDHYSSTHGYICWECLRELKEKGACNIDTFMWSEKSNYKQNCMDWEDFVDGEFVER